MQRAQVVQILKQFIKTELLEGEDRELDESTPLLEWGILDSYSVLSLLAYVEKELGVRFDTVDPERMKDLRSIADLVTNMRSSGGA